MRRIRKAQMSVEASSRTGMEPRGRSPTRYCAASGRFSNPRPKPSNARTAAPRRPCQNILIEKRPQMMSPPPRVRAPRMKGGAESLSSWSAPIKPMAMMAIAEAKM